VSLRGFEVVEGVERRMLVRMRRRKRKLLAVGMVV
jgi:hypothetical protein